MNNQQLKAKLKEIRKDHGLSVRELGEMIGKARPRMSRILNGTESVGIDTIFDILSTEPYEKVDMNWLFRDKGEKYLK